MRKSYFRHVARSSTLHKIAAGLSAVEQELLDVPQTRADVLLALQAAPLLGCFFKHGAFAGMVLFVRVVMACMFRALYRATVRW